MQETAGRGCRRLVTYRKPDQISKYNKYNGGQISHCQRKDLPIQKEKTKMHLVLSVSNSEYQCELTTFNI